ncbi:MAG: enoyl-CoA hydratase/isomerase family protein [Pseudomonadota bacterium]
MTAQTDSSLLIDQIRLNPHCTVAVLTLNRPKALNALNEVLVSALHHTLDRIKVDDNVVAVVLGGAGEGGFCAGGDIKAMHASVHDADNPCVAADAFFDAEYRLDHAIHTYPKPFIVWGHGIVMGGGLGLFQGAQYRVLETNANVAMPEVSIGLFPDVAASYLFHQLPQPWGRFFALTGCIMNTSEAYELGITHYQTPSGSLPVFLKRLTVAGASLDAANMSQAIERILQQMADEVDAGVKPLSRLFSIEQAVHHVFSDTSLDQVDLRARALLDDDIAPMLRDALNAMLSGSPVSVCCSDLALNVTRNMTLSDVFQFDLMLVSNMIRCPDFSEGVRAMLIDKDKQPRWMHADIASVPELLLESMLEPIQ